jgi:hypothetical protein
MAYSGRTPLLIRGLQLRNQFRGKTSDSESGFSTGIPDEKGERPNLSGGANPTSWPRPQRCQIRQSASTGARP